MASIGLVSSQLHGGADRQGDCFARALFLQKVATKTVGRAKESLARSGDAA